MDLGFDLLECDVHLTKDGVVLVSHDQDYVRLCGVDKHIKDVNYADIPPMKRLFEVHFSNSEYSLLPEEDGKFTTLRELFELAPTKMISIDLKGDSPDLKDKVNQLIIEFKREHLSIWGSMKPAQHKAIGRLNPDIP
jgi:glycerophosphoryl diester phosphodiesterase